VAVLIAALSLKIGTYGFVRFSLPILPDASREFGKWIAVLAASTLVYAGAMALRQREWTRLVSWASVSQMGLVTLGIFALSPAGLTGGVALQINHGGAFAAMVLAASAITARQGREADGVWHSIRNMRVPAVLFLIATLSAAGAPLLGGFAGTRLIARAALGLDAWWAAAAAAGVVLGACALLRLLRITLWAPAGAPMPAAHQVVGFPELAAAVPLVVALVWFGINPAALLTRVETAVGRAAARVTPALAPYVARGSDCATPAPPDPAGPPPAFVLAEPCADGSTAPPPASDRPGRDR
jgi:NADH-quinone oxidoreductase subunit M